MSNTGNIESENKFVYRLMNAKCSFGSMSHPLNVAQTGGGHGVLFGPEAQPILNANDWRPNINIIHFGDCTPRPQDTETGEIVELEGFAKMIGGFVEFIIAQKCSPMIERVWYETEKKYLIDGAPVLLVRSLLFCKRGGIITIEATPTEGADGENNENAQTQAPVDIEQTNAEVAASVDQALAEGKIDAETAQFMKDGYGKALEFADGDIETANQLFSDLLNHGGDAGGETKEYASSEAQYDKFKLYLEHNDSPLIENSSNSMTLGKDVNLGEAVSATLTQSQKNTQGDGNTAGTATPIITTILN